jgi:hypothetical protein
MPTNRVTALMNDGEGTAAAVAELVEGGLPEEEIFVLCGVTGLERLDLAGRHHSLRDRLYLFGRSYGRTPEWLREAIGEHLESGGLAIIVPADEDEKPRVAQILARHGGFEMAHFGRMHWEELGSVTPNV